MADCCPQLPCQFTSSYLPQFKKDMDEPSVSAKEINLIAYLQQLIDESGN